MFPKFFTLTAWVYSLQTCQLPNHCWTSIKKTIPDGIVTFNGIDLQNKHKLQNDVHRHPLLIPHMQNTNVHNQKWKFQAIFSYKFAILNRKAYLCQQESLNPSICMRHSTNEQSCLCLMHWGQSRDVRACWSIAEESRFCLAEKEWTLSGDFDCFVQTEHVYNSN